ncbi:MAG: hypothetical protein KDA80_06195 [Planctomycetaceae bacterium]|nr:hypothetical protein [Planctomycetaceae bacterium]
MKKLSIFTFLGVLILTGGFRAVSAWQGTQTQAPQEGSPTPDQSAQPLASKENDEAIEILRSAQDRLFQRESVRATISQRVSLGDYKFASTGRYVSGAGFRSRLEYRVELGDLQGTFLEVCDGQILHTRRVVEQIGAGSLAATSVLETQLSRRDIEKILREARNHLDVPKAVQAAEIGIGGLPAVLASIERSMILDAVREETVDGASYDVVQGRWDPARQESLLGGLGAFAGQIGQFLPDLVRVYFNRETQFPERFIYLKLASEERQTYRPILKVEFTDIQLDQPIGVGEFSYIAPPGAEEVDETMSFIQMIQQFADEQKNTAPVD